MFIKQRLYPLSATKPKIKTKLPDWLKNAPAEIPAREIARLISMYKNNPKLAKGVYKTMKAHVKGKKLMIKGWEMMQKYKTGPKHEKGYQIYRNGIATLHNTSRLYKW